MNTAQWENELESLNNALISLKLDGYKAVVNHNGFRSKATFFLMDDEGITLTGSWNYDRLNHFIMGYGKAMNKINKQTMHPIFADALKPFGIR